MCTLPMRAVTERGVRIDRCANDHTFFDLGELGQVDPRGAAFEEALLATSMDLQPEQRRRPCARCGTTMVHLEHEGQKAEVCQGCGAILLWVDLSQVPRSPGPPEPTGSRGSSAVSDVAFVALEASSGLEDIVDVAEVAIDSEVTGVAFELVATGAEAGFSVLGAVLEAVGAILGALAE
jgi:Zn-finger nucleic acid-binding protein